MQPYIFPYLGYFNLIHASSLFVFLDDVQYIRRGWINSNRIQQGKQTVRFTVPLSRSHRETKIHEKKIAEAEYPRFVCRFERQLKAAYGTAPYFKPVRELVLDVLQNPGPNMAWLAQRSIISTLEYIGLKRDLVSVIGLDEAIRNNRLLGENRIIHICKSMNGDTYVNLPGGKQLYQSEQFEAGGIQLRFVEPKLPAYERSDFFVSGLSIIDLLMYLAPERILSMCGEYLLSNGDRNICGTS